MLTRELRDFVKADYPQSLGMVAFLLESEPARFMTLLELLRRRQPCQAALEEAYGRPLAELEAASVKWLLRR
jgi:hypothetical protein